VRLKCAEKLRKRKRLKTLHLISVLQSLDVQCACVNQRRKRCLSNM